MDFVIKRASEKSLPKEAKVRLLTYVDRRTATTLEEAHKSRWGTEFFAAGTNHREEAGLVVRDLEQGEVSVFSIESFQELIEFVGKYGNIIIGDSYYKEIPLCLIIYDDYME